ncbi:MAG TPA: 4Fe-4S binding protein [Methanospirillum sp.]|jgi:polyferredoxin|uniref:4Fe-4S binding protein n=1 Tax=Methanospirillum sp. TaxID=45200 RepID=UPI0009D5787A|nr:4Fe-4S binding protein [Methanospirillum sp.]OQB38428.1 MAG: Ferredoxin [Euryarchaeota archaeon ADurb.Bin165]HPY59122.1 4Fe-4S binding protein [Methanospirillum sp.]HQB99387.1 4Fe-4S binding protein [Methanospirillum sp.]
MNLQKIRRLILLISILLLPVTLFYLSPVLIMEGASSGIFTGSAILFTVLFFISLFAGRIWCGWFCPFGSLQDLSREVQGKRVTNPWIDRFRYGLFVIWILMLFALFIKAGGILSVDPFYQTIGGLSITSAKELIMYTGLVLGITAIALIVGRRGMCHLFCPISVLMIVGRKIRNAIGLPALQLTANPENCISCGRCTKECPQSLDVFSMVEQNQMERAECILCGACIDVCPRDVIRFSFGRMVKNKDWKQ